MATTTATSNRDLDLKHLWHGNLQHEGIERRPPIEFVGGEGCWVWDADGNRYLDSMAGLWCVHVGYGRR